MKYREPFSHVGRIDELKWHFYYFYVPKRKAKHSTLNTINKLINNLNINKPVTVFRLKETEISETLIYISKFSTPTFLELYYNMFKTVVNLDFCFKTNCSPVWLSYTHSFVSFRLGFRSRWGWENGDPYFTIQHWQCVSKIFDYF